MFLVFFCCAPGGGSQGEVKEQAGAQGGAQEAGRRRSGAGKFRVNILRIEVRDVAAVVQSFRALRPHEELSRTHARASATAVPVFDS